MNGEILMIEILAPHPDDEIIGCYSILARKPADLTVYFLNDFYPSIVPGIKRSLEMFTFSARPFDENEWCSRMHEMVYCPDPQYDIHPAHQYMGNLATKMFREGRILRLRFYTTMMNSPYIWEVKDTTAKREALNTCYPEKSDLWTYDHRYWLFEGYWELLRLNHQ
jgi:hypothetical protein